MKTKMVLMSVTAAMLILNGCGDGSAEGSAEGSVPSASGILTDSPVAGATYMCGNVKHKTDQYGAFSCDNTPIAFYVGSVKLGEVFHVPEDRYVTPQDLAGVSRDTYDENVAKIAVFLQSLDDDGEIESTIVLDKEKVEKLNEKDIELQKLTETNMIELLDQCGAVEIVAQDEALEHLRRHTQELPDKMPQTPKTENTPIEEPKPDENGALTTTPSNTEAPNTPNETVPEDMETPSTPIEDDLPVPGAREKEAPSDVTTVPDETETPKEEANTPPKEESLDTTVPESSTPPLDDAFKQAYLDVINEARAEGRECGEYGYFPAADPLSWNDRLYAASYEHSKDMAISNTFSHTGSGTKSDVTAEVLHPGTGSSVSERIEHNGYTNWRRYGENIAAGTSMDEAVEAMEGWLASPGHCKNIMKAEFKEVGMAVYYNEESHYKYYWTQDFGTMK